MKAANTSAFYQRQSPIAFSVSSPQSGEWVLFCAVWACHKFNCTSCPFPFQGSTIAYLCEEGIQWAFSQGTTARFPCWKVAQSGMKWPTCLPS